MLYSHCICSSTVFEECSSHFSFKVNKLLHHNPNYLHSTTNFEKADEYYCKALQIKPDDVDALGFSALNKIHLKQLDEAYSRIEYVLEHETNNAFMYFIAGKILYLQGNYEDAKMYLIKSYELEKTNDTENMLGLCYYELGDYEQANNIFKHMLEDNPLNVNLLLNSARCYKNLNDKDSALSLLDKITDAFPECEEAQEMIREIS